mmetsp:Transcript_9608/g.15997  ORF Transcript_9608/g.15997 Transcript_9608/m.15997 type:complete len:381 (-) Transcript_9608:132-1274(-)|eukprot:CAMPEP_0119005138 /NCGR_PEP_ID=MMETSP1176-20130426/1547_1 /TAXON_ID=265551 /ORGANISM="Synedropsis recta cf, Strain CCMP1620" /LENGTH=380 /DNA_ID=CAMNT_0006956911 /DNA_START=50 /DNA_END=1192 /DNA_ORIENTATION=-
MVRTLTTKKPQKRKLPILSNSLSFLLGVTIAYLIMQQGVVKCPAPSSKETQESEPQKECDCEKLLTAALKKDAPAVPETEKVRATGGSKEKSFYDLGLKYGTDKIAGKHRLPGCLQNNSTCTRPGCVRKECRPWGHWYHTLYQQTIGKYSLDTADPFQFLEIGFFNGRGYQTYREFFTDKAEVHSMEISCLPEGKREEGKWPWGNFAKENENYQKYLDEQRLHCVDASNTTYLDNIWRTKMHRPDAPPLMVVVDDGSHLSAHMAQSVFFWFPRIEPGGLLVIEDIQPIVEANLFRTQFLPQMMSDLHFCGDPKQQHDEPCFPLLQKMLHSIHCEMHICIFERNEEPAIPNLPLSDSTMPANTFKSAMCPSLKDSWGTAQV